MSMLGPERVRDGDVLIGLGASGLHSNGYSLVRRVISHAGWQLDRHVPEFGRTLGEELLEPTKVYAAACLDLASSGDVHAYTHVTGGGLAANLARVIPAGLTAIVRRNSWVVPPVFSTIQQLGSVPWADLEATLNLGVGMVAVVPPAAAARVQARAQELGLAAWELGVLTGERPAEVVSGTKGVDAGLCSVATTGSPRARGCQGQTQSPGVPRASTPRLRQCDGANRPPEREKTTRRQTGKVRAGG